MSEQTPTIPPLAFRPLPQPSRASLETVSTAYSASIPDVTPPPLDMVSFEREDRPYRPVSLPRHSPLPAARSQSQLHVLVPGHSAHTLPTPTSALSLASRSQTPVQHSTPIEKAHPSPYSSAYNGTGTQPSERESFGTDSTTPSEKAAPLSQILSIIYGFFVGLVPILLPFRPCLAKCNLAPNPPLWDQRWYVYGRSLGLLALVSAIIIIVVLVETRR